MKFDFLTDLWERNTDTGGAVNLNCIVSGKSGSGKSYAGLKICEQYYEKFLKKKFSADNVVFTIREFLERIQDIEKNSCIIFDDAGLSYGSSNWYDELNKILGYTLQSYRYRIINLFFTVPNRDWLDRIGRGMTHSEIKILSPGNGAYYRYSWGHKKEPYTPRSFLMSFELPSKQLIEEYENKKHIFIQGQYKRFLEIAIDRENAEKPKLTLNEVMAIIEKDPLSYTIKGRISKALVISKVGVPDNMARDACTILNNVTISNSEGD